MIGVTGLGCFTSIATNKDGFFSALMQGRDGIGPVRAFDVSAYSFKTAAEAQVPDPETMGSPPPERAALMLRMAALEAVADASLFHKFNPERTALMIGTTLGGTLSGERFYRELRDPRRKVHPKYVPPAGQYSPNDALMACLGLQGPNMVISTACSASAHTIGQGMEWLRSGLVDVVLAGGVEPLSELTFSGFGILRSISTDKIRPFDRNRSGLVLGEGAAVLVLERAADARRRGARIYAQAAGYGSSSDAYHMTAPHKEGAGAAAAMRLALQDAGIPPEGIDYINAHGTATPANDPAETRAIKQVLGARAYQVPISSIKSMIGHTLGAAGAIEAVATVLSVHHNAIPPTINYQTPDPECDLDYVPNEGRELPIRAALTNSFGFGGNNAALVFTKP